MAEALAKLSESIYLDNNPITSSDLLQRLRSDSDSDSIRPGLQNLLLILKRGVEAAADGKLGLQSWTDSQIQAVYSLAYAVVSASRSLSGTLLRFIFFFAQLLCLLFSFKFLCFFVFFLLPFLIRKAYAFLLRKDGCSHVEVDGMKLEVQNHI